MRLNWTKSLAKKRYCAFCAALYFSFLRGESREITAAYEVREASRARPALEVRHGMPTEFRSGANAGA
jgi:hypothetical protein